MEAYELEEDTIIQWATSYASYEELEKVAKALYGIYAQHRKNEYPTQHKKNKQLKKAYKK